MGIPEFTIPAAAQALWILALIVAYASLPILLVVLTRIVVASRKIAKYLEGTREHSRKLPGHLAALPALDETAALLTAAKGVGADIAVGTETLADALLRRAGARS